MIGQTNNGISDFSIGIREMAMPLAARTPLAAKLASAEKHITPISQLAMSLNSWFLIAYTLPKTHTQNKSV